MESDNALERILKAVGTRASAYQLTENVENVHNAIEEILEEIMSKLSKRMIKRLGETAETVARVEGMAAGGMVALSEKLDKLLQRAESPKVEALEHKIEEILGQLVSMAQRGRRQQELLDRVLEKVSTPPPPPT